MNYQPKTDFPIVSLRKEIDLSEDGIDEFSANQEVNISLKIMS